MEQNKRPIRHFRDLIVYQEAVRLAAKLYAVLKRFPANERFGLQSQAQEAAVSVVLNIAEGYGRKESEKEFARFLRISLGSCNEVMACLDIAVVLGYANNEEAKALGDEYERVGKRIWTLADKWSR